MKFYTSTVCGKHLFLQTNATAPWHIIDILLHLSFIAFIFIIALEHTFMRNYLLISLYVYTLHRCIKNLFSCIFVLGV